LTYLEDYDLSLDSLLIYTCLEHCLIPSREGDKMGWAEETAVSQSYTSAGVTFGRE
jgi:predicted aconitase